MRAQARLYHAMREAGMSTQTIGLQHFDCYEELSPHALVLAR